MSGVLNRLSSLSQRSARPLPRKEEFPLADPEDARVLYVLSERARRVSLKVKPAERRVHVVLPGRAMFPKAVQFARANREWIAVQLEHLPAPQPFVPGGTILFQGDDYRLVNPPGRGRARIDRARKTIVVPSPDAQSFPGRVLRLLKREARAELEAATHHYAGQVGKRVAKVSVRDTSSRWGSAITRDRLMIEADGRFPGYGFARHKGYPTQEHLEALERLGPCPIHRRRFGPVGLLI